MTEELKRPRKRRLLKKVMSWVLGIMMTGIVAIFLAVVIVPLVMGWIPLTVLTGSMEPTIPPGSQVVVKPLRLEQAGGLKTGQVITFLPEPGKDDVVTHRIIDVEVVEGETVYRTKGDNNNAPDPDPVRDVQVRGLVRYHVPYVGYVAQFTSPEQKKVGIWILAGLLILYAVYELVKPQLSKKKSTGRH